MFADKKELWDFRAPQPSWPSAAHPDKVDIMSQSFGLNLYLGSESTETIPEYDMEQCFSSESFAIPSSPSKHGRQTSSGEQSSSSYSSKLGDRVPFLSKRWMHRKNSSLSTGKDVEDPLSASSRTSSFTSVHGSEITAPFPVSSILRRSVTAFDPSPPVSPGGITAFPDYSEDPVDRKKLSSTPLLPPLMNELEPYAVQSPLQSPSIADQTRRTTSTISGTTEGSFYLNEVPLLSRSSTMASSEQPPTNLIISDKWSKLLGHANFTIIPAPYMPEKCDREACHRLFMDWDAARTDYFKHQARTQEHYGTNSKIYRFTEDKWAEIEAQWRRVAEEVTGQAIAAGEPADQLLATSPFGAFQRMPTVSSHIGGKFPQLGDSDIVGPLMQGSPARTIVPIHKKASHKAFGDWKLPHFFKGD